MAGLGPMTAAKGLTEAAVVVGITEGVPSMEVLTQRKVINNNRNYQDYKM